MCLCVCVCMCGVPLSPVLGTRSAQDFSVLAITSPWILLCTGHCKAKVGLCRGGKAPLPSLHWSSHPNTQAVLTQAPLGLYWGTVLVGLMPTFSRSRALTCLPSSVRATPHSRGVKHDPQLAGGAAAKYMVSGYHMKWKPALLGSCTVCFGVMLCLKRQVTLPHPLAGWGTWMYFTELQTLLPPFALLPPLSLAELQNCPPYPGCYPHLITATVFRPSLLSHPLLP